MTESSSPRIVAATSLPGLAAHLRDGAVVVGGAVGLMSAAVPETWGALNVDLSRLGLDFIDGSRGGAMVRLADLRAPNHPAVEQAVSLTASPGVRRLLTVGGVLGARRADADLAVALAAHTAAALVLQADESVTTMSVPELWRLRRPFAILEVHLGAPGPSYYRRFSGHQPSGPAIACVAGAKQPDGQLQLAVGAPLPEPRVCTPTTLPTVGELSDNPFWSRRYRHAVLTALVDDIADALEDRDG